MCIRDRDHDARKLAEREEAMREAARRINEKYGEGRAELKLTPGYRDVYKRQVLPYRLPRNSFILAIPSFISAVAAFFGSSALIIAPESEMPLAPHPARYFTLPSSMPPIATEAVSYTHLESCGRFDIQYFLGKLHFYDLHPLNDNVAVWKQETRKVRIL